MIYRYSMRIYKYSTGFRVQDIADPYVQYISWKVQKLRVNRVILCIYQRLEGSN